MSIPHDRRESHRLRLTLPSFLKNISSDEMAPVDLLDLSFDGVKFSSKKPLTGTSYWITIEFNSTTHLRTQIQIEWQKEGILPNIICGAAIINLTPDQMNFLSDLFHSAIKDKNNLDRRNLKRRTSSRARNTSPDRRFIERASPPLVSNSRPRVVITGLGVASSIGIGKNQFLNSLLNKQTGLKFVEIFKQRNFPCFHAGIINQTDLFDQLSLYSKILKEDALSLRKIFRRLDKATQLGLIASLECIADSEIPLHVVSRRSIGFSVGTILGGLEYAFQAHDDYNKLGTHRVNPRTVAAATPNCTSGELASLLKLRGPSATFSQGCTSGMNAVTYAINLIQAGRANLMLAGGADSPFHETIYASFCRSRMLAPSNESGPSNHIPLDAGRKGTVLGEGAGFVMLEDLHHALARGANIYAEIVSDCITCDGYEMMRGKWHGAEASRAIQTCLANAGLSADDLSVVFAHATGSIDGDAMELRALHKIFGEALKNIPITNVKSLTGYSQAACGPTELITACLAMKHGFIPAIANFKSSTKPIDASDRIREKEIRNALLNCFGFGGKNIAMVISRYEN